MSCEDSAALLETALNRGEEYVERAIFYEMATMRLERAIKSALMVLAKDHPDTARRVLSEALVKLQARKAAWFAGDNR
jgi:hypothetical protein